MNTNIAKPIQPIQPNAQQLANLDALEAEFLAAKAEYVAASKRHQPWHSKIPGRKSYI